MRYLVVAAVAAGLVLPAAGQARRPQAKAFPLSFTGSLVLNTFGTRAEELDAIFLLCTTAANCIQHSLARGPGAGAALQVPVAGTIGLAFGLDAVTMLRRQCIPGGNCSVSDRLLGLRARGEFLFRLKARAPIYFGLGAAAMRTDPGTLEPQTDPTIDIGGVFTIGADVATSGRTGVRIEWNSFFLKADDAGLPATYETRVAHDGVISIGVRYAIAP